MACYSSDGILDQSFDYDGMVTTNVAGFRAESVAVDGDDRIVVAGQVYQGAGDHDFAAARYTPDGQLDSTFGASGLAITDFAGLDDWAYDVAIDSQDRVILAGAANMGADDYDVAMVRYTEDGGLDSTFGNGGYVTTDLGGAWWEGAYAVTIDGEGKILLAGQTYGPDREDMVVARYHGLTDTTPPVVQWVDAGTDLHSLIVQFNDDDLAPAQAQDPANFQLIAANGDADADGDAFNDGDEFEVAINSVTYDPGADRITIHTADVLFDDFFRLEIDGDDATSDGTPGIIDLSGNSLAGGDYVAELDLTCLTAVHELLDKVEALGLSTGADSSLTVKLAAVIHLLGEEVGSDQSVLALMGAFIRGLNHWYEKDEITLEDRDELIADAELIELGISLTSE